MKKLAAAFLMILAIAVFPACSSVGVRVLSPGTFIGAAVGGAIGSIGGPAGALTGAEIGAGLGFVDTLIYCEEHPGMKKYPCGSSE